MTISRYFHSWLRLILAAFIPLTAAADPLLIPEAIAPSEIKLFGSRGGADDLSQGLLLDDGGSWNGPGAIILASPASAIVYDFGSERSILSLILQADNNDSYIVETSADQMQWTLAWTAPSIEVLQGMRSRWKEFTSPLNARYLRVRPGQGDGNFSLSRLLVFEKRPAVWPHLLETRDLWQGAFPALNQARIDILKSVTAVLGLLAILWRIFARRCGAQLGFAESGKLMLLGSGALSLCLWWNLFNFHFPNYLHAWDFYHYYMGAKYLPELGYNELYDCTLTADVEAGLNDAVATQSIRNLHNNRIESPRRVLDNPALCKSTFSNERWQEFTQDAAWFRSQMTHERWVDLRRDHGFNGTPVWAFAAGLLAKSSLATPTQISVLALLDALFLIALWVCVLWAFGWETLCVAAIFWGTNYPARFFWHGGSFLRQDWLFFAVLSICLLKREKNFWAGAALAYAAMLRIFPILIAAPLVIKVLSGMWEARKLAVPPPQRRFALGALLVVLLSVPAGILNSGHASIWSEFAQNSEKHLRTPLTNNMGLKTVLSYDYETRAEVTKDPGAVEPYALWKSYRISTFAKRAWIVGLLAIGLIVYFWRITPKLPDWIAAVAGVGLIPLGVELTCYYYSILLAFGLLWNAYPWAGFGLALTAWLTCQCAWMWDWYDESFTWMSAVVVLYVFFVYYYLRTARQQAA